MSRCNFGYPAKDLALQNLSVNNIARVENLIKSTRAEIYKLCAYDDYITKASITYNGNRNISLPGDSPPEQKQTSLPSNYRFYSLPSGNYNRTAQNVPYTNFTNPSLAFCIYTDIDLVVKMFQAFVQTEQTPIITQFTNNVNVSLEYGTSPTSLTNLLTLSLLDTKSRNPPAPYPSKPPVRVTRYPDNVIIPAGSYYTIVISEGDNSTPNGVGKLVSSWTLKLEPL